MVWCPSFQSRLRADGVREYRVGHELVDEFLEFASGRARPATVRAYAHDLSVFFGVIGKEPADVTPKDVLRFVTAQRRPRSGAENVVRISDGESGLSTSTIKRRLAAVSSLYGYLVIRGDAGVVTNPVPRGLPTRRNRHRGEVGAPLVRGVRRLPRILNPDEVEALMAALRTDRDRALAQAMLIGGLRRGEVLGLRLEDLRLGEWRVFIAEGKGGHQRLVPISPTFFAMVAAYMNNERPPDAPTDRLFPWSRSRARDGASPLSRRDHRDLQCRSGAGRPRPCHVPRAAPHLSHEAARSGHGPRGRPGPGRSPAPSRRRGSTCTSASTGWPRSTARPWSPSRHRWRSPDERPPRRQQRSRRRGWEPDRIPWDETARRAPVMVATMASYLDQLGPPPPPPVSARQDDRRGHRAGTGVTSAGQVTQADSECTSMAGGRAAPHRSAQALARRSTRQGRKAPWPR